MSSDVKRSVAYGRDGAQYRGFREMTLAEYHQTLADRWGSDPKQWRVVCPSCGTVQSLADFFAAAKPTTPDEENRLARMIGFSCIGRELGATGAFNRAKHSPCNYTSGGLFCVNSLVVLFPDGKKVPAFEPADL